ncbi:putative glycoside hydrolase [Tenggerimyces flavus]|uniref:Glycoside hydrolase n=1 Tax=Tenggerimyces flavus TaxID=1708749 RepID=A0ABV7YCC3_9ACTN|nr:putative glycoside hydrolase [Tenggerimyces flavus]MBM7786951.1 hypothetical protein [Tenggerimyces flavus]
MRRLSVVLTVGVLAVAMLCGPATASGPVRPLEAGQARSFWLHLNGTPVSDAMIATEAQRRDYVVLNAWEGHLIPKLKAANPAIEVFVYKDLSSTRSYACRDGVDDPQLPTGVGYCDAEANHPEWFLLGSDGQRLEYAGYPGHWQMDVGDPDYQATWVANVVASSTAAGFDGILMDNALFPCDAYHAGTCPAKYPTDAAIQDAYVSMLASTREELVAAGLRTVANLSNARLYEGVWDTYTEHLDGGFDEWWLTFSDDDLLSEYPEGWSRQVAEVASNEARGKITWVQPHFTPGAERPFRYALASYLMASDDAAAIAEMGRTDGYGDPTPWHGEYDWDLGAATGPYRSVGTNLFRRDFACGAAVVNANRTDSAPRTVELGGEYLDHDGAAVTSIALAGTSGAVLRKSC